MCHYDEVVGSVAGSAAGRLTARRSCFQPELFSAGALPGGARDGAARAAIVP